MWVGIGGFSQTSNALEQIGTEVDCTHAGSPVVSAWYELVPAPSNPIRMTVRPGDVMAASVVLHSGRRVTLTLIDETRHRTFRKTIRASAVDATSAEWILEAPSECISATACQTLQLANFGTAQFGLALARSSTGHIGPIADPAWSATQITLSPHGRRYVSYSNHGSTAGGATPSSLDSTGSAFSVSYSQVAIQTNPFLGTRRAVDTRRGHIVH
jgi:hypothetical protein